MGGRKKFTAKDQSTSADRPKSAPAERIWQGFDGEVDIFGSKLICELAAGSKGHGFRMKSPVRPELPTASVASSQASTAAVDNSAPSAARPQST